MAKDELLLTRARLVPGVDPGPDLGRDGSVGTGREVQVHVSDGTIVAIGTDLTTDRERSRAVGPDVRRVDLGGRFVLPGLWDHHVHLTQWALARQRLDVSSATSAADVARRVVDRLLADRTAGTLPPDGVPLTGFGFRSALWPDVPTASLLDDALAAAGLPAVPVVLVAGDLHCAWLSTPGLRLPSLARFGLAQHPTGVLREGEYFEISDELSVVPPDVLERLVADATRAAAARGVVGVMDVEMADNVSVWPARVQAGMTSLRVRAGVWREHLDRAVALELATGDPLDGTDGLVTMGPLKVISDGSLNTRTAYCHDEYPGLTGPGARGVLSVGPEELVPLMAYAARHGIECAIHAIGDHANTLALDAFEASGARGSVEHAQLLVPEDLDRFAALGIAASVQPEHAMDDRDVIDRYWPGREGRAFAFRDLLRAGAVLHFGSDAPVAPLDPWLAISAAVTRTRDGRDAWHPEQSVPVDVALAASVSSTVAVGQPADLAVVELDPLTAEDASLRSMPVAATLLGGRFTWNTLDG